MTAHTIDVHLTEDQTMGLTQQLQVTGCETMGKCIPKVIDICQAGQGELSMTVLEESEETRLALAEAVDEFERNGPSPRSMPYAGDDAFIQYQHRNTNLSIHGAHILMRTNTAHDHPHTIYQCGLGQFGDSIAKNYTTGW